MDSLPQGIWMNTFFKLNQNDRSLSFDTCEHLNGLVQEGRKWLFRVIFFSFKSAWIFACAFQFRRKTFSSIFFWLKCSCLALLRSLCMLRYFVFVFLRNKVQTSQINYRGMVYYLIEKQMQKFRHFWRKKNYPKKSLPSLLHQAIHLLDCPISRIWGFFEIILVRLDKFGMI